MIDTWKAFCPEEDVAPFINMTENCFNVTGSDFIDAQGLNFNLAEGALSKCSSTFSSVFQTIPFDAIGSSGLGKTMTGDFMRITKYGNADLVPQSGPSQNNGAPKTVSSTVRNFVENFLVALVIIVTLY